MTETPRPEPQATDAAEPARDPAAGTRLPALFALMVAGGALAGGAARLLFLLLPGPWGTLANTSALWGLVPFFAVVALRPRARHSAVAGAICLAAMVAVWVFLAPAPPTPREVFLWGVVGVVAGALCGLAGGLVRRSEPLFRRSAAAAIGGVVLGEGLYGILLIGGPQWWLEAAVGVALALAWGPAARDRAVALAGAVLVAGALFGAFVAYDAIAAG